MIVLLIVEFMDVIPAGAKRNAGISRYGEHTP